MMKVPITKWMEEEGVERKKNKIKKEKNANKYLKTCY